MNHEVGQLGGQHSTACLNEDKLKPKKKMELTRLEVALDLQYLCIYPNESVYLLCGSGGRYHIRSKDMFETHSVLQLSTDRLTVS